jgi:hypothetical protein
MRLLLTTAAAAALALTPAVRAEDPEAALKRALGAREQARAEFDRAQARTEIAKTQLREAEAQKAAAEQALAVAQKAADTARERAQQAPRPTAKPKGSKKGGQDRLDQILRRLEAIEKRLDALERKGRGVGEELPPLQVTPADQYREDAKPSTGRVR